MLKSIGSKRYQHWQIDVTMPRAVSNENSCLWSQFATQAIHSNRGSITSHRHRKCLTPKIHGGKKYGEENYNRLQIEKTADFLQICYICYNMSMEHRINQEKANPKSDATIIAWHCLWEKITLKIILGEQWCVERHHSDAWLPTKVKEAIIAG